MHEGTVVSNMCSSVFAAHSGAAGVPRRTTVAPADVFTFGNRDYVLGYKPIQLAVEAISQPVAVLMDAYLDDQRYVADEGIALNSLILPLQLPLSHFGDVDDLPCMGMYFSHHLHHHINH